MNPFQMLFTPPAKTVTRRARPGLEALERRDLPSTLTGPAPIVPIITIPNPIQAVANAEYAQDGKLTRTDVINLLETAAGTEKAIFTDGMVSFQSVSNPNLKTPLSALAFSDLQTIANNGGQWGLTADVLNLFGKVVGFNQANEKFDGKTLLNSGKLAAGDSDGILQDLVEKWFYGTDLPTIGVGGTKYEAASGNLFGPNGPQATDVAQGDAGDCYFLSNLAETALQSPQTIENMFINNSDGTYTVRFYELDATTHKTEADYVTVNSKLPVNSKGEFVYANNMFGGKETNVDSSSNILWVALAEKAYAQLASEGWSRPSSDDANAYKSINIGDNLLAGEQITGNYDGRWLNLIVNPTKAQENALINTLEADFQKGDLLTICTNEKAPDSHLDSNHVYFVSAIDTKNDTVTLTNPYETRNLRTVTISLAYLAENAGGFAVDGL